MRICSQLLLPALWLSLLVGRVQASQPVTIGIVEFVGKGGVDQKQVDSLADRLAREIGSQGAFRVVGQADVLSMLDLENQKCLTDCTDECCFAWIGNAMGARWTITGNLSRFGSIHVLNLKLIDVLNAKVAGRASRRVKGSVEQLHEQLEPVVKELLSKLKGAPTGAKTRRPNCANVCEENQPPHCVTLDCILRHAAESNQECTRASARAIMELNPDDLNLVLWKHDPRSFEVR